MATGFLRRLITRLSAVSAESPELALRRFAQHFATLSTDFFSRAAASGKPRGLKWVRCDWLPDQVLVRERESGLLTLLVGINLHFEAIEGSDMEEVAAVSSVRDACAVFHYQKGSWGTGGRVLFNMHPADAADRLSASFEPVAEF